jgi:hypothetical protein
MDTLSKFIRLLLLTIGRKLTLNDSRLATWKGGGTMVDRRVRARKATQTERTILALLGVLQSGSAQDGVN